MEPRLKANMKYCTVYPIYTTNHTFIHLRMYTGPGIVQNSRGTSLNKIYEHPIW